MAASLRKNMFSLSRFMRFACLVPLKLKFYPSTLIHGQQLRLKTTKNQKYKAPHEAKEQVKWTSQKKTNKTQAVQKEKRVIERKVQDNVWIRAHYAKPVYAALQAVEMHKELAHPSMLDNMDGHIIAKMTLDFTTKKKTKFLKPFQDILLLPNLWDHGETRNVLAFCKESGDIAAAVNLGAVHAGGVDLVNQIERGEILREQFDYIVSTYDIATELVKIRPLIKDLFPNKKNGNLGHNITDMMELYKKGHRYQVKKTAFENEGDVEVVFGKLTMTNEQLEENLMVFIRSLCAHRSPDLGPFIKEASFLCPPSSENFLVDLTQYMPKSKKKIEEEKLLEKQGEDSDDEAAAAKS